MFQALIKVSGTGRIPVCYGGDDKESSREPGVSVFAVSNNSRSLRLSLRNARNVIGLT